MCYNRDAVRCDVRCATCGCDPLLVAWLETGSMMISDDNSGEFML